MSQVNVTDQAVSFLMAALLGAAAEVFYCFFCALRRHGANKRWQVFVQDIAFWLIIAVATFCFLLIRCRGEVRGFVLVGEGLGFLVLRLLLSEAIIKFFLVLFAAVDFFRRPMMRLLGRLAAAFSAAGTFLGQKAKIWCKKIKKGRKRDLKAEREVLYNDQEFNA